MAERQELRVAKLLNKPLKQNFTSEWLRRARIEDRRRFPYLYE